MAREVKFQLGSTLRGLGTSKMGDACTDYQARHARACFAAKTCTARLPIALPAEQSAAALLSQLLTRHKLAAQS